MPISLLTTPSRCIAIGGCSRSGKTTLANLLISYNISQQIRLFPLDEYVFPEKQIPLIRDYVDWEHPLSTNFPKLHHDLSQFLVNPGALAIIEGLVPFWQPEIRDLITDAIYLHISRDEFLKRKENDLRWGIVPQWYKEHIFESHLKFGLPPANLKHTFIDANDFQIISSIPTLLFPNLFA